MNMLWYGLKVAVMGMLVVFVGLIILIGCIKLLSLLSGRKNAPDTPKVPAAAPPVAQPPAQPAPQPVAQSVRRYTPGPWLRRKDPAFYAVIGAAVAQVMAQEGRNPEGGFAIRDVKTVSELTPGPEITPKDDAFFAVVAGAVSKVMESEGKNPDGGFAIRSIKAL